MEYLTFTYDAKKKVNNNFHVGVVASGDLEILIRPTEGNETKVSIKTGSDGFKEVWGNVLTRFFERYSVLADITINDFGATPGVVYLRLTQALEGLHYEN